MTNNELIDVLKNKKDEEFIKIIRHFKNRIKQIEKKEKLDAVDKKFQEKGIQCPNCKSYWCVKNGFKNNKQKYLCKDCKSSFDALRNHFLHWSHLSHEQWDWIIWLSLLGQSAYTISQFAKISKTSAWFNRQKFMKSSQLAKTQKPFTKLKGRIEIDETFIKEIHKGNFKNPDDPRKKWIEENAKDLNCCIEMAIDENKNTDFSPHVLVEETMKLNEFNNIFQTEKDCLKYIASLKENKCMRCSWTNLNTSDLRRIRCLKCHQTFSILHDTIFYKSQTPLTSWFYLIFRWINTKHGIPSTDVAKELGVTLKTAWRMGHKIRSAIAKQEPQFIVEGIVQMDEMYLSHMGFKKQGRSLKNKTLIVGIYEKTTNNLIVKVFKNANQKNLLQFARNHISSKCDVHTDSWKGYRHFKSVFTKHETVNHQDGYVSKTGVNINQIESAWKHIRRTFKTHIKVEKHHVHLYAKESAYKFNNIPGFETVMLCLI